MNKMLALAIAAVGSTGGLAALLCTVVEGLTAPTFSFAGVGFAVLFAFFVGVISREISSLKKRSPRHFSAMMAASQAQSNQSQKPREPKAAASPISFGNILLYITTALVLVAAGWWLMYMSDAIHALIIRRWPGFWR